MDYSDLTFRELETIPQALVRILNGIFPSRVEYPDTVLKEMERRKGKSAAIRSQSAG